MRPATDPPVAEPLLSVQGLHAGYGHGEVLHGIDVTVPRGQVVVLLGANGAGKTTLMRCISGELRATGRIELDGDALGGLPAHQISRRGVALVPQGRGTFADLSVRDNLAVAALQLPRAERDVEMERWLDRFPRLAERSKVAAGMLSGGEQQMLAIARACIGRPRVLMCDEPSLGLSPAMSKEVFEVFEQLHDESGLAMLIVEQNAGLALGVADLALVIEGGRIVWRGTPRDLHDDDALVSAYIGDLEEI
ncbi:ABC transporter ATP-binding protein [Nocardioides humi]|uniref:ABC transporter ATP-binding protein n=1 Tax=Nocardioides humi TaxID=449461 RepID=A0ABN2A599_9ACTN|nr:ABC transporter ATP-binding protein [Nocardioides humi]